MTAPQVAFAQAMDRLGPFEPAPRLAVAVSGGADSMALALLAQEWVLRRQGTLQALVVDHRLRPGSAEEAAITVERLGNMGISATVLALTNLPAGSALAERARIKRYRALLEACRSSGSLHLLVGHHAADQVETMMMRALARSGTHGLAAMSSVSEQRGVRLLRPLLGVRPKALRQLLRVQGVEWAEDPSNHDLNALRPRLRHRLSAHLSDTTLSSLTEAATRVGLVRAAEEAAVATELARRATIRPEGFALLSAGPISAGALASLIRTIGGSAYAPSMAHIIELAAQPRTATIAGVRLMPAGRYGSGLLVVREEAAVEDPVEADADTVWDHRFRLIADRLPAAGLLIGKLGSDAALFRQRSELPSAVLRTLPAIRHGKRLEAVPHLGHASGQPFMRFGIVFTPPKPLAGSLFVPA